MNPLKLDNDSFLSPTHMQEKSWVRQVREEGNREVSEKFFRSYYKRLHGFAYSYLLLAEAAERNWISGTGVDYFAEGVRAHLEQMEQHHPNMAISQNGIDDYVTAQRVVYLSENPYEHIHTQYWVAGFIITPREVFSNWRRTGYPQLDPNPYPDQEISGDFIRRRKYLEREISVNAEQVQSAIGRQGWSGNNLDERVWWDMESYNPN